VLGLSLPNPSLIPLIVQVITLESTWKSGIKRDNLKYLKPNPFYLGVVRMLMEQQKVDRFDEGVELI